MENSILTSTKNNLGIPSGYDAFDHMVLTHINSAFSTLSQLGIGPEVGFFIEDESAVWQDFNISPILKNTVKSYVYLKVRLLFDPPGTSFLLASVNEVIKEHEWRLVAMNETPGNEEVVV